MEAATRNELLQRRGENHALAALAVLEGASGKKRLVQDGTRAVAVNNRIRCRSRLRMPQPAEK
eukprot:5482730-Alexandrium_andersonii.AAC.1